MTLLIKSSSDPEDVVWEPFGGLCSASVAGAKLGRKCYAAEITPETYQVARQRIVSEFGAAAT